MHSLQNKVIIITGGSDGIGKALVMNALQRGGCVATCSRNFEKLQAAFSTADPNLLLVQADVTDEADCKKLIDAAVEKWGRIDVLINNAGMSMRALFEHTDLSVLKQLMDVNFWGAVYCTKQALPFIKKQKGVIAGISSIAGYRGLPARTGYSSSKFALQGFLEALRTELLETGTHVMWISPGFTSSNIRNVALSADGRAQKDTPLNEAKLMSADECAGRILDGIKKRKRTIVMTGQGKLTVLLNKFFPALADRLVYKHFLNEPDSPLTNYK